jgi:hypothetical protein
MMATQVHLASSTRLILAMFQLIAAIEDNFGRALFDILSKQYPDQVDDMVAKLSGFPAEQIEAEPATAKRAAFRRLGNRMLAIARRELQHSPDEAIDVVQDFLTYIATGSKTVEDPETGERTERTEAEPWDFTKADENWQGALKKIFRNIKTTGISRSQKITGIRDSDKREFGMLKWKMEQGEELDAREKAEYKKLEKLFKSKKVDPDSIPAWDPDKPWGAKEKGIEEAFGKRGEEGEEKSGGEGAIPTTDETALGKALDDKAAVREFIDLIDLHLPDLKSSLSEDTSKLFDLIFEDEIGSFGSDIKENMGQASALKEKYPELYEANKKRWSGFVGDLRKKLLKEIFKYIDTEMSKRDYERLYEEFFADTTPRDVEKREEAKVKEKESYQRGIDERKLGRLKYKKDQSGKLSDREQKEWDRLVKKLNLSEEEIGRIEAVSPKSKKGPAAEAMASLSPMARRLAINWLIDHGWFTI